MGGVISSLEVNADGSVSGHGVDDALVTTIEKPWAVDAAGVMVPTEFEVAGTTLTQVVRHHGKKWSYGITADPSLWKITKCGAAITVAVGSTVIVAAKILKIKKLISAAGGVKKTASRVIKSLKKPGSISTKAEAGFKDLGIGAVAAAVLILDIDTIQTHCS